MCRTPSTAWQGGHTASRLWPVLPPPGRILQLWVQRVMSLAPTTHFTELSQAILYWGAGLEVVWTSFVVLLIFGSVLFALSLSRFRKTIS